jgi:hypothetical protein
MSAESKRSQEKPQISLQDLSFHLSREIILEHSDRVLSSASHTLLSILSNHFVISSSRLREASKRK